ncbi:DUF294 nucleotidyltransferase-like domain-containing protein [Bacillus timonensis]|uniref:DUF294 nucleotidyltransferase-like domain-containing protein n=1 Tax=Bacillus timonensis TaxID=1033734 RepID=UPI001E5B8F12|nr:DUF294 nucleotidyltransferase-like domain-containing protein [Bacillus timonensis]
MTSDNMQGYLESYQSIKEWRNANVLTHQMGSEKLQLYHDFVIKNVFEVTLNEMSKDYGPPPCTYTWFVMGSAGRCEQAVISDQDHGIIFEKDNEATASYFLVFGQMLSSALRDVGYPLCEGNVMSSNPLWCQSYRNWEIQLKKWMRDNTWISYRNVLIFMDARVVVGDEKEIRFLKEIVYQIIQEQPTILERLVENTKYTVKGVGLFNQFLTVSSGPYTGYIDLKTTAVFPYVNAIRILSILEKIEATSTIARIEALRLREMYKKMLITHYSNFKKLMHYRFLHGHAKSYEDMRYLNIKGLTKLEKLEIKQIIKDIEKLQRFTDMMVQGAIKQ